MPVALYSLVPIVTFLFTLAYLTFVYEILYQWTGIYTISGNFHNLIVHTLMFMLYYTYFKAVRENPGNPPPHWVKDFTEEQLKAIQRGDSLKGVDGRDLSAEQIWLSRQQSDLLQIKYCRCLFCHLIFLTLAENAKTSSQSELITAQIISSKKEQMHTEDGSPLSMVNHISDDSDTSRRINNCVGHRNHRMFMLFLLYLTLTCAYLLLMIIIRLFKDRMAENTNVPLDVVDYVFLGLQIFILAPTLFSVSFLFGYQLWLIGSNTTGIEYFTKERERKYAKRHDLVGGRREEETHNLQYYSDPFDLGLTENLKEVFGSSLSTLLLPVSNHTTTGRLPNNKNSIA
ncbi:hypothetical protein PROFUN_15409 [Planoprotostelium fungivorum]|uniref:Palmitoyltransferase n=1 Tax=Planoprotostelium fungivorum TaxID=1890364 RepID=A0A2P6MW09_9EUKA|nr:hypothetical protein PROFUN_15409 [Planoprotostelium fungivorum]